VTHQRRHGFQIDVGRDQVAAERVPQIVKTDAAKPGAL
jgi:hypothetical protein